MNKNQKPLVVITGASHGIGAALADKFFQDQHSLLLVARHMNENNKFSENEYVMTADVDVSDYDALNQAIAGAEERYGPTECLINNAGMINIGEFSQISIEKHHQEVDVLLKGVINGIKAVLSTMEKRQSGTIINMSSIGDRRPAATGVVYHASKHAVASISESLQQAQAKNNVRVMNFAPGLVKTNIHSNMGISFEEYSASFGNPIFLSAEEIADIVYFCWQLPQHICVRDLVVMPTSCGY